MPRALHPSLNRLPREHGGNYYDNLEKISADNGISDNCALFISGLKHNITYKDLLKDIHGTGRVFSIFILPPKFDNRGYYTAAARIVMWDESSARRIIGRVESEEVGSVGMHNNVKISPQPKELFHCSRVICVQGLPDRVNKGIISRIFDEYGFQPESCEIIDHTRYDDKMCTLEYRFICYRKQADRAMAILRKELKKNASLVFGRDPCEQDT